MTGERRGNRGREIDGGRGEWEKGEGEKRRGRAGERSKWRAVKRKVGREREGDHKGVYSRA